MVGAMEEWKSQDGGRIRSDSHASYESGPGLSVNSDHEVVPDPVELDQPLRVSIIITVLEFCEILSFTDFDVLG